MSWNHPSNAPNCNKVISGRWGILSLKILFVVTVIAIILALWYLFWGSSSISTKAKDTIPKKTDVKLKTTNQSRATNLFDRPVTQSNAPLPPQKVGELRDGYVLLPNGKLHKRKGLKKVSVAEWNNKGKYQIFDSYTDNEFAALLTLKPGEMIIGGGVFPKDYEQSFLNSLKTPIIVSNDDPDDVKEVKRAVIQTRIELKQAIDRGEDIKTYIKSAYEEAQKLSSYKDMISDELRKLRDEPNLTEEDIDIFVEASNKILESKGIAPIKIGPLTRWRLLNQNK